MDNEILDKFTSHLRNALARAYAIAVESNDDKIKPVHLLLALTLEKGSVGADVLLKVSFDATRIRALLARQRHTKTGVQGGIPSLHDTTKKIIEKAVLIASVHHHTYVGTEHLLGSMLQINDHDVTSCFELSKVNRSELDQQLQAVFMSTGKFPDLVDAIEYLEGNSEPMGMDHEHEHHDPMMPPPGHHQQKAATAGTTGAPQKTPALSFFTTNLTNPSYQKAVDPMIGRAQEVERMIQILSRRTKNNPMLLGDPGVGKTAIVEGLARRIMSKEVPDVLIGKKILSLDLGLVIAGTMYRGEFEARIKQIVDECSQNPDIVLFIDEIHTLVGAGATNGSLDAANMLKPALARGLIKCIGATTETEYKKHIENDPALERRFQTIHVKEPSEDDTLQILKGIKRNYEQFHKVEVRDDAIEAAVRLSARYITDRFFPDKAIDLIDEAAATVAMRTSGRSERRELLETEEELTQLEQKKLSAINKNDFGSALKFKQREKKLKNKLYALKRRIGKRPTSLTGVVTSNDIAHVIAQVTGVPIENLQGNERDKLQNLESILSKRVIGQQHVINEVAQSLRRARLGLSHPKRPMASFLFVGPSGVGKTELAKAIAETVFGSNDAFVRIDMSEFREQHNVAKLIGSPAGYVGYKEQTQLSDQVKRKPHTLVLFDEIDKSHPDVLNLLLQILEEGHVTDASGKKINFKNTIIVMTAAMGLDTFGGNAMGFGEQSKVDKEEQFLLEASRVKETLKEKFKGEILNRIDKIAVFKPLTKDDIDQIIEKELKEVAQRVESLGFELKIGSSLKEKLLSNALVPEQGARMVRKIIAELVEDPVSNYLVASNPHPGTTLTLGMRGGSVNVTAHTKKQIA